MRKAIRTLEAPLYLLVIALCVYEIEQTLTIPLFLVFVSVVSYLALYTGIFLSCGSNS